MQAAARSSSENAADNGTKPPAIALCGAFESLITVPSNIGASTSFASASASACIVASPRPPLPTRDLTSPTTSQDAVDAEVAVGTLHSVIVDAIAESASIEKLRGKQAVYTLYECTYAIPDIVFA